MIIYKAEKVVFADGSQKDNVSVALFNGVLNHFVFVANEQDPESGVLYNTNEIRCISGIKKHNGHITIF